MDHETLEDEVARLKLELSRVRAAGRAALAMEQFWRRRALLSALPDEPDPPRRPHTGSQLARGRRQVP